jgi:hypothetical protein
VCDVKPPIWNKRHEVGEHDVGKVCVLQRDRLVTREREPDKRIVRRTPIHLDVAVPQPPLVVEEDIVRRNLDKRLRGRCAELRMFEARHHEGS